MTDTPHHPDGADDRPFRRHVIAAAKLLGASVLLAALVHVSWNMFAPDMFGLDAIRFKQALGLVVFAGVFAFLFRIGGRIGHRAHAS